LDKKSNQQVTSDGEQNKEHQSKRKYISPSISKRQDCGISPKITLKREDSFVFKNIRYENIVRWEDCIIFDRGTYDEKTEIYYYDLSTNNKSLIYEKDLPKGGMEAILSYFDVLEGSLYFSIGGYIQDGTLFQMDLPYTNPPQKIINLPNSKIVEIDNRQFIVGGDGDGCGGYAEYALFDPITQTASPIITKEGMGCVKGNTILGIYKNTFITSYHNAGCVFRSATDLPRCTLAPQLTPTPSVMYNLLYG
jgi:hypothetical protein